MPRRGQTHCAPCQGSAVSEVSYVTCRDDRKIRSNQYQQKEEGDPDDFIEYDFNQPRNRERTPFSAEHLSRFGPGLMDSRLRLGINVPFGTV
jgi:hypothetical protein